MRGPDFGRAGSLLGHRIACVGQLALRAGQPVISLALLFPDTTDRRLGFGAAIFQRAPLFFGAAALERDDLSLARKPGHVLVAARQLRRVRNDVLFLAVLLGDERRDRGCRLGNRDLELAGLVRQPSQYLTIGRYPFAQLLDLAACGENAARFHLGPAGDEMRAAQNVSVQRGDRRRSLPRKRHRLLEGVGDVGLRNDLADRHDVGSLQAHHLVHGHDSGSAQRLARVVSV